MQDTDKYIVEGDSVEIGRQTKLVNSRHNA